MAFKSFKQLSREFSTYGPSPQDESSEVSPKDIPTDKLILGCLMRIADMIENFAAPFANRALADWAMQFDESRMKKFDSEMQERESLHGECPEEVRNELWRIFYRSSQPSVRYVDVTKDPECHWGIEAPPKFHPCRKEYGSMHFPKQCEDGQKVHPDGTHRRNPMISAFRASLFLLAGALLAGPLLAGHGRIEGDLERLLWRELGEAQRSVARAVSLHGVSILSCDRLIVNRDSGSSYPLGSPVFAWNRLPTVDGRAYPDRSLTIMAIETALDQSDHNLKYLELIKWDMKAPTTVPNYPAIPKIAEVVVAYEANVSRLRGVLRIPAASIDLGRHWELSIFAARKKVPDDDPNFVQEFIAASNMPQRSPAPGHANVAETDATLLDGMAGPNSIAERDISVLMSNLVTNAWTAFEVLATDLWEQSLNCHPADLAVLAGDRRRIAKLAGSPLTGPEEQDATRSKRRPGMALDDIQNLTLKSFDLSDRMGTILKRRFKFSTITGIRKAYSRAFDEKPIERIDKALADNCLDALSMVRNLIVHRGQMVDAKYIREQKSITLAPQGEEKKPLVLNGTNVVALLGGGFKACAELIEGVNQWMKAHPPLKKSGGPCPVA